MPSNAFAAAAAIWARAYRALSRKLVGPPGRARTTTADFNPTWESFHDLQAELS